MRRRLRDQESSIRGQPWRVLTLVWKTFLAALMPISLRDLPAALGRYVQHLGRANERNRDRQIKRFLDQIQANLG